jgi:hypothetical protein
MAVAVGGGALAEQDEAGSGHGRRPLPCQCGVGKLNSATVVLRGGTWMEPLTIRGKPASVGQDQRLRYRQDPHECEVPTR